MQIILLVFKVRMGREESDVRFLPFLCLAALDAYGLVAHFQVEVTLLENPFAVSAYKGERLGRQTERYRLCLSRLQFHLCEITQTAVVRHEGCHEVAAIEKHRFLSSPTARVANVNGYGEHIVGAIVPTSSLTL